MNKEAIYFILIITSIMIGFIYQSLLLSKNKVDKEYIALSMTLSTIFILIFGIVGSMMMEGNVKNFGFYSGGGAIGYALSTMTMSLIINDKKHIFYKTASLTLPLMYSISKTACMYAKCCSGIPYTGILSVESRHHAGTFFPIQLVEVALFLILFIVLNIIYKKKKDINIIFYSLLSTGILKFLLDFLRYEHANKILLTKNQIITIILLITLLIGNYLLTRKTCKTK